MMVYIKQSNKEKHAGKVHLLACAIFQLELEQVLEQIRDEKLFDCELIVTYLQAGLHNSFEHLKYTILKAIDAIVEDRIILLYGSRCHPEFDELLKRYSLIRFPHSNCIELISGKKTEEINQVSKTFYLTPGWLLKWREIFDHGWGLDEVAIRQSFGYFDRILLADTNTCEIIDEQILDFFEYTRVPIEIENIGLETFKSNILAAIKQALE